MPGDRRVLARLVGRYVGTTRGVFELGDGRHVEAGGVVGFDSAEAPEIGGKALVVMDESGGALSWEPYAGARPPSPRGPRLSRGSSSLEGRRPRVPQPWDATRCCGPRSSALGPPHCADRGDRAQVLDQHPVDGES